MMQDKTRFRKYAEAFITEAEKRLVNAPDHFRTDCPGAEFMCQLTPHFLEYCKSTFVNYYLDDGRFDDLEDIELTYDAILGKMEPLKRVRIVAMMILEITKYIDVTMMTDSFLGELYGLSLKYHKGVHRFAMTFPGPSGENYESVVQLMESVHYAAKVMSTVQKESANLLRRIDLSLNHEIKDLRCFTHIELDDYDRSTITIVMFGNAEVFTAKQMYDLSEIVCHSWHMHLIGRNGLTESELNNNEKIHVHKSLQDDIAFRSYERTGDETIH